MHSLFKLATDPSIVTDLIDFDQLEKESNEWDQPDQPDQLDQSKELDQWDLLDLLDRPAQQTELDLSKNDPNVIPSTSSVTDIFDFSTHDLLTPEEVEMINPGNNENDIGSFNCDESPCPYKKRRTQVSATPVTQVSATPVTLSSAPSVTQVSATPVILPSAPSVTQVSATPVTQATRGTPGIYTSEERKAKIAAWMKKRGKRKWRKIVEYDVRKNFADSRLRFKGRFVKKEDEELLREALEIM